MIWKRLSQLFVFMAVIFLLTSVGVTSEKYKVKSMMKSPAYQEIVADEIIVKFKGGVSDTEIEAINQNFGTKVKKSSYKPGKFKVLKIKNNKSVEKMLAKYRKHNKVEYAEPNSLCYAQAVPNDSLYSPYQWHFDNDVYGGIQMEQAWDITTGDASVVVAVLDSGVAYEDYREYEQAPDLAGTSFVAGYDFINDDAHPNDDHGHGTHVTGTIAQETNNKEGVAGIAYNTSIMPVKVLDGEGSGTATALANALYWATENGADVINMSLSWAPGYDPGTTVKNAIAYAHNNGVTLVAAAGNDEVGTVCYPAAYDDYVIAVGATRYDEQKAYYSNWGSSLDVTAPGGDVTVNQNGDGYNDGVLQQTFDISPTDFGYIFYQGTSMASPHVAGVAALLIANGTVGPDNVRAALENTAKDKGASGWDETYGHGIIDAYAALLYNDSPPVNSAPVADPGGPYIADVVSAIQFDGSDSYDPEGDTLTYSWDFGDGNMSSEQNPIHAYSTADTYTVALTVSDGEYSDTETTQATITEDINQAPVADAGGPYSGEVGDVITFDGFVSYDPENEPLSYEWDFGDASSGTGVEPTHSYASTGTYTATLVVNDGQLDSAPASAIVTITEPSPDQSMAVSKITMGLTVKRTRVTATATLTLVDNERNPVSGATVSAHWSGAYSANVTLVTDANGSASHTTKYVNKPSEAYTFTIDDVVKSGYVYAADVIEESVSP